MSLRILGPTVPSAEEVGHERCFRSFAAFVKRAWQEIDPAPLVWGWHLDALCLHLQAVEDGRIRRLVINIPPGHAKSIIVAVLWNAWRWLRRPGWRVLCASYAKELSLRDARRCRALIETKWYQGLRAHACRRLGIPDWKLADDANQAGYYANTAMGERKATGVEGQGTGYRGDCVLVDDPLNASDAASEVKRQSVIDWWTGTMVSRLNDLERGEVVVIMQRLHEADLAGHLLAGGQYTHLCLPTEFETVRPCGCPTCKAGITPIGWSDPRKAEGELLFPAKFGPQVIADAKNPATGMGAATYAAQHQQRPVPAGGRLLKPEWLRHVWRNSWEPETVLYEQGLDVRVIPDVHKEKWAQWCMAVDCAFKKTEDSDRVAVGVWARTGADLCLLDLFWERAGIVETIRAIRDLSKKWPKCTTKLIEEKANGSAVIELLRMSIPGIIPVQPDGGKEARVAACAPFFEAGNIWIPMHAPWRLRYAAEACAFPSGAHDDAIDMSAYAITRLGTRAGRAIGRTQALLAAGGRRGASAV